MATLNIRLGAGDACFHLKKHIQTYPDENTQMNTHKRTHTDHYIFVQLEKKKPVMLAISFTSLHKNK